VDELDTLNGLTVFPASGDRSVEDVVDRVFVKKDFSVVVVDQNKI
jgi:hypothetical protein